MDEQRFSWEILPRKTADIFSVFSGGGGGERAAGTRTGETKGERSPGSRHPQWDGGQAGAGAQGERGERVSWGGGRESNLS